MISIVKKLKRTAALVFTSSFLLLSLQYCDEDPTPSLFDRVGPSGERPVITSVTPDGEALNGVSEIVIDGQNFSSVIDENLVTFGAGNGADILEASPTRIVVKAPLVDVPSDSDGVYANIRVAVVGSELASEYHTYRLLETVKELFVDPIIPLQYYGICVDANTNIYASAYNLNVGNYLGEYIHTEGVKPALYNQKGFTHFSSLNFGPGGIILGARADRVFAIFEIAEGITPDNPFLIFDDQNVKIFDIDTDDKNRIWAGGSGDKIFSVSYPDKQVTEHGYLGLVNAVRIFKDGNQTFLYTSTVQDSVEKIFRSLINEDGSLGSKEEYFDLSPFYNNGGVTRDITFAQDGDMYVGNTSINPIIIVSPDKSIEFLYPELLKSDQFNSQVPDELVSMAWGISNDLYMVRRRQIEDGDNIKFFQNIVRVLVDDISAPYYGRN